VERKVFNKGNKTWEQFATDCIIGCYSENNGESIAGKTRIVNNGQNTREEPKEVRTKAYDLGILLKNSNTITITDLMVFELMDDLRKAYG